MDKPFIVGRFFRSVIMYTFLSPIKQLKNILFVECCETGNGCMQEVIMANSQFSYASRILVSNGVDIFKPHSTKRLKIRGTRGLKPHKK